MKYTFIQLLRNFQYNTIQLSQTTPANKNNIMQKSSNKKLVQIQTKRSANMIPPEESAEILENNLTEQLKIVRLLQEILRMETLQLERMMRERFSDKKEEGKLGQI